MTQSTKTYTVKHIKTGNELGVFTSPQEVMSFCQENKLTPMIIPAGHGFKNLNPLYANSDKLVMFVFDEEPGL